MSDLNEMMIDAQTVVKTYRKRWNTATHSDAWYDCTADLYHYMVWFPRKWGAAWDQAAEYIDIMSRKPGTERDTACAWWNTP
jgi:hypothetical protein